MALPNPQDTSASPGKKWYSHLMYGVYLLLVCTLLLEASLRLLRYREYRLSSYSIQSKPAFFFQPDSILGFHLEPGSFEVVINNGLTFHPQHDRSRLRNLAPTPVDSPLVYLLGCSYTYGWGLEDSACLAYQLQSDLPGLQLKSLAIPGIGPTQFFLQLQEILARDKLPQWVVLNYCSFHDERAALTPIYRKNLAMGFARARGGKEEEFASFQYPYAYLQNDSLKIAHCGWKDLYENWPFRQYSALVNHLQTSWEAWSQSNWRKQEISQRLFEEMNRLCAARGVNFVLAGLTQDKPTRTMLDWAEAHGIRSLDISLPLKDTAYHNAPFDSHPNARAHDYFSQRLRAFFLDLP